MPCQTPLRQTMSLLVSVAPSIIKIISWPFEKYLATDSPERPNARNTNGLKQWKQFCAINTRCKRRD